MGTLLFLSLTFNLARTDGEQQGQRETLQWRKNLHNFVVVVSTMIAVSI